MSDKKVPIMKFGGSYTEDKCGRFLEANGWKLDSERKYATEGDVYLNDTAPAIQVLAGEIVFLDDSGDFLHIPKNYFALVGAMIEYRMLTFSYNSVKGV